MPGSVFRSALAKDWNPYKEAWRMARGITPMLMGVGILWSMRHLTYFSIGRLLEIRAALHPRRRALLFRDEVITYGEFNRRVNRIAHCLADRGIVQGDCVSLMMENSPEALIYLIAVTKLGAIGSMMNTAQRGELLHHSLSLTNPKMIIASRRYAPLLTSLPDREGQDRVVEGWIEDGSGTAVADRWLDMGQLVKNFPDTNPATTRHINRSMPCFYVYTSGTTGRSKASVMTHSRWLRSMAGIGLASLKIKRRDILYCSLPLFHNNALTISFAAVLGAGACMAISEGFSASRFWTEVIRYRATMFCYIGEICRYLLAQPPSPDDKRHRIRSIVGNGLRAEIWAEFKNRFAIEHINEFYSASECNLAFTNGFNFFGTAGYSPLLYKVIAYDAIKNEPIRDPKGRIEECGPGETGLLITKITRLAPFDGYTDSRASEEKLLRHVFKKGDCYLNTGDLVLNQGHSHVAFVDRVGDTFRWKGENVATSEVEGAINLFPQVKDSVVYGVIIPRTDGRAGMVALTLNCPVEEFDFDSFRQEMEEMLPAYALPLFIRFRAKQEMSATFKYQRGQLREQGFDPFTINDNLYAWIPGQGYARLTKDLFQAIGNGKVRY